MLTNSRRLPNIPLVLAAAALLPGCGPARKSVYVDLDKILAQEPHPNIQPLPIPAPPPPRPATTQTFFGIRARTLRDPESAPKLNVEDMFHAAQATAQAQLLKSLLQLNKRTLKRFELRSAAANVGKQAKAYQEADAQIGKLFTAWADQRAPIFDELSWLTGFPIPPASPANQNGKSILLPVQREREVKLRAELGEIDTKFKSQTDALLDAVRLQKGSDEAKLRQDTQREAAVLDQQAREIANAQIRNAVSKLQFELAQSKAISVPGMPASRISIPAEGAFPPMPQVPSGGILDNAVEGKRLLEHQLQIWLALKRYTLSTEKKGRRDATQEFESWRQTHGVGP